MKRVFIAGPYSADNIVGCLDNMRRGMRAGSLVLQHGMAPFTPWHDFHHQLVMHDEERLSVSDYYAYSLAWLEVSDYILVLPGWEKSKGTLREMERARELGIPVVIVEVWSEERLHSAIMSIVSRAERTWACGFYVRGR